MWGLAVNMQGDESVEKHKTEPKLWHCPHCFEPSSCTNYTLIHSLRDSMTKKLSRSILFLQLYHNSSSEIRVCLRYCISCALSLALCFPLPHSILHHTPCLSFALMSERSGPPLLNQYSLHDLCLMGFEGMGGGGGANE